MIQQVRRDVFLVRGLTFLALDSAPAADVHI